MSEVAFTIFTATYNRAHTLHRVYQSLTSQTLRDLEWIVIDDGSTDSTAELIEQWQREADFPIVYKYQSNSGSHVAHNWAASIARGEFFAPVDSDDAFVPEALARIQQIWNEIPAELRANYTGVTVRCIDQHGEPVGKNFAESPLDATLLDMVYLKGLDFETWGILRTEIARAYPFPSGVRAPYIPPGVIWNRMARRYVTRFVNDRLRVYYMNEGVDNLSGTGNMTWSRLAGMAPGTIVWHRENLLTQMDYFSTAPTRFFRSAVHFVRFSWITGRGVRDQWNALPEVSARLLWLAALIPGSLVYLRDRYHLPKR